MDSLLNISDRVNAALHALALAARAEGPITAAATAARLGVSPSYLSKVLQSLAKAGILESSRGAAGGFVLARDPAHLTALEILELLDGPLPSRNCIFRRAVCRKKTCALKILCDRVASMTHDTLASITIERLAANF